MTEFESKRLIFRTLAPADATDQYVDWLNDPEVNRYLETRHSIQTKAAVEEFILTVNNDPNSHLLGMFEKPERRHIGNIKLGFIKTVHGSGQLSLFIGDKSRWRKGYATEAIRTVTGWGFDVLGLERVEAGCYDENLGALRAFLQVGFSVEGYFRQSLVLEGRRLGGFWMGILRHELR